MKFFIKKGGSSINQEKPYFRTEFTFGKEYKMDKLIKCIYLPEFLLQWDKNNELVELSPIERGKDSYVLLYQRTKKTLFYQRRDFYEKSFKFVHDGVFYSYSCTIPNSERIKPSASNVTRGETLFNFHQMYRDSKT